MSDTPPKMLYRSDVDRIVGGVAGGLGEYFHTDPLIFRLLFVILVFASGSGIMLYLLCWIFIPDRRALRGSFEDSVKANAEEIASEFEYRWHRGGGGVTVGIVLVLLGLLFLAVTFGIFTLGLLAKLWPLFLIIVGIQLFLSSHRR